MTTRFGEDEIEDVPHYHEAGDGIVEVIESWRTWVRPDPWTKIRKRRGKPPEVVSLGREKNRLPEKVIALELHQTDVAGGFGAKSREHLLRRYEEETPYHCIYNPRYRLIVCKLPVTAYSYHGNGGNRYSYSVAYDGKLPGDELDAAGFLAALVHAVETCREQGAQLEYVEGHRQHDDARGGDPGEQIWRACVLPLLAERPELRERPHHTSGTGRPILESWRVPLD